jgi:hypothetical protein
MEPGGRHARSEAVGFLEGNHPTQIERRKAVVPGLAFKFIGEPGH